MHPARYLLLASLVLPAIGLAPGAAAPAAANDDDDVVALAPYDFVDSALEDFGLQVRRAVRLPDGGSLTFWPVRVPQIIGVLPNTAASRAGLTPGEFILRADGKSARSTLFSRNTWQKLQNRKLDTVAASSKPVTWTLEVRSFDGKSTRTVALTVPTPAPHWGDDRWTAPVGRTPVDVSEPGPLAARASVVLNHGIWSMNTNRWAMEESRSLGVRSPLYLLGYSWTIVDAEGRRHRIFVTRQRGHTEIVLESTQSGVGISYFLTSPSGALEKLYDRSWRGNNSTPSAEESRDRFEKELAFWTKEVTDQPGRWPLELAGGTTLGSTLTPPPGNAPTRAAPSAPLAGPRAAQFLQLPKASEAQRALFDEAFGKLGADEGNWAYTETSRGLDDNHQTVVRVDPSKPEAQRVTLLRYDGKPPTAAQLTTWREQGRDNPAMLGELPPLNSVIDFSDLRISADETASVLFELPIVSGNAAFPAEKFQALVRVNKTRRSLEDITVKMREAIKVAGVVKITDAGLEARFQTFDPAYPPQPVSLKAGGAARILLVKLSRSFEATRTDYVRVTPYVEPALNLPLP